MRAIFGISLCFGAASGAYQAPSPAESAPVPPKVNCTGTLPGGAPAELLCKAPFNCNDPPKKKGKQAATDDGHADFSGWCLATPYFDPAIRCAQSNLSGYAVDIFPIQESLSPAVPAIDAQYCMEVGHCGYADGSPYPHSGEITPHTTIETAEKLCDARWGHDEWAKLTALWAQLQLIAAMAPLKHNGTLKAFGAIAMSKLSCAMGNYHCDAIYCRETYCKNPKFAQFLNLRPTKATDQLLV